MGEGLFSASHKAKMCQNPCLTVTYGKQRLEELFNSPELLEEDVVTITLRNKTEKQLERQTLSSLSSPNHMQR